MENQNAQSPPSTDSDTSDALEGNTTVVESAADAPTIASAPVHAPDSGPAADKPPAAPSPKPSRVRHLLARFNIYLILFIILVLFAIGGIIFAVVHNGKSTAQQPTVTNQTLSASELSQLQGGAAVIGNSQETLTIQSDTTFNDAVLIKSNLSVAGTLKLGGSLTLPGISVAGSSDFAAVQANSLLVSGDVTTQGALTVQKGLSVTGSGNFGGTVSAAQLVTSNLQLEGDLQLSHHIITTGGTPSKVDGSALGSGGTASVSGTDTSGTISINVGNSPGAGCFVTLTFAQKFSTTPHVVVTPVGAAGAGLQYYVTPSGSAFSLCSASAASAGASFNFDYIVIN